MEPTAITVAKVAIQPNAVVSRGVFYLRPIAAAVLGRALTEVMSYRLRHFPPSFTMSVASGMKQGWPMVSHKLKFVKRPENLRTIARMYQRDGYDAVVDHVLHTVGALDIDDIFLVYKLQHPKAVILEIAEQISFQVRSKVVVTKAAGNLAILTTLTLGSGTEHNVQRDTETSTCRLLLLEHFLGQSKALEPRAEYPDEDNIYFGVPPLRPRFVTLHKSDPKEPWGMFLKGGEQVVTQNRSRLADYGFSSVVVSGLQEGGVAEKSGVVFAGDVILGVNGYDFSNLEHQLASKYLQNTAGNLCLLLHHVPSKLVEAELSRKNEEARLIRTMQSQIKMSSNLELTGPARPLNGAPFKRSRVPN